jgi:phenylacetate-CoA ligase
MAVEKRGDYYDELETMSPADRETYLNGRLRTHLDHTYQNAPAVKKLLDDARVAPKDIAAVKDLEKLPITRKQDLIDMQQAGLPFGGVTAIPNIEVERVFISPGPIYEVQPSSVEWFAKSFRAAGFRKGDVVINTFTYHLSPAGILFHEGIRDCGATVVVTGTGNTDLQIQIMRDLKVNGFVGTPSFLMTVLNRAAEMGLDPRQDLSLRTAWFTGEMLAPSLRVTFENDYNIDTYQTYAVTEPGGAIAYECREKSGMHLMDEFITEIVDPETGRQLVPGEIGEIVTTQVCNPHWGLIRFGTGDLSSCIAEPCPCGRTAYRLTGIVGRAGDAVKVRGMFIVTRQAEEAIKGFGEVGRYQLVVGREQHRDTLILKLEPKDKGSDISALVNEIGKKFQDVCRLKIDRIEAVGIGAIPEDRQGIIDERKWD